MRSLVRSLAVAATLLVVWACLWWALHNARYRWIPTMFPPKQQGPGPQPPIPMPIPGAPMGPPPGMPQPGTGVDPILAMLGQAGPGLIPPPPPPSPFPQGPNGLPPGGAMPDFDGDEAMPTEIADSPIISALMGGADPYGVGPMEPPNVFDGAGVGDPNSGMQQLIQLLMLAQSGLGGTGVSPAPSSGAEPAPGSPGMALGLGL